MRLAPLSMPAAVLVAAWSTGASAQGAFDVGANDPLILYSQAPSDRAAAAEGTEEAPSGRAVGQQPVETADALDDTITASIRRRTIAPESDPYAALGVRAGGFVLFPSLTVTTGYTSNASGSGGGSGSAYGKVTPELDISSDWAEHEATLALRGSYERFFDGTTAAKPTGTVAATGRIDVNDGWSVNLDGAYDFETQAISDPGFPAGVDSPPGVHGLSGSAAVDGGAGRGVFALEGSVERTIYENGTSAGLPVDQGDRTNTVSSARLRLGYQATPSLTPFVEVAVARRAFDRTVDIDGLMRSSTGQAYRAGVMIDREPVLGGEIAVGYAQADFDDASLATLAALTVDGSLIWAPSELTTVSLNGATSLNPSADPASSVVYDGSVDLAYAWRRNVTVEWTIGARHQRFQGTGPVETGYRAGVSATWKANRWLQFTGGYVREWLNSTDAGRGYQSDAIRLELRAQR